ncbi:hypothetical protein [Paenibacillus agricola]|uniref:VWFA domain-containing protein n=1 Tax=Paenibacillus agricola TaxID=2716264 RepID=A0ABX0JHR5_9BACL|nr:hypothetical protein [Paenibacillus agricola]NHN34816.1 hypothetical protein [Paenibacillus agricola]
MDLSPRLQIIEADGLGSLPLFSPLMGDMWSSLFKVAPTLLEEVETQLLPNHSVIERLLKDENYQQFRSTTVLDDFASAVGSINLSEKVLEWVNQQASKDQEFAKMMREARELQHADVRHPEDQQSMDDAAQAIQQKLQEMMALPSFSKALQQGYDDTKSSQEALQTLFGGLTAGDQKGELHKVPLNEKIALADKLKRTPKLKKIAEWAGRFKVIAQKKQRTKSKDSLSRSGVSIGDTLERLLPTELALLQNPLTKLDFYRKYSEKQLMQYEVKGKEELGKGAFILCLDQSGSMSRLDDQSKGFMLALMAIAKKQKRDFAFIPFDTAAKTYKYEKGKITMTQMVELAETFLGGGTDFIPPLSHALEVVKNSKFKNADIIFVTDGVSSHNPWYEKVFSAAKKEHGFNVLSILLGTSNKSIVKLFSDNIVLANDFTSEEALKAFEI